MHGNVHTHLYILLFNTFVKYPLHFNTNATTQLNDYDLNRIYW